MQPSPESFMSVWESPPPFVLDGLEPLSKKLSEDFSLLGGEDPCPALAELIYHIIKFCDMHLGAQSPSPRVCPKPAAEAFCDFSEGGGLYTILETCYKHKEDNQWRRFDILSGPKKERNLELILRIRERLAEKEVVPKKRIFFAEMSNSSVEKYSQIVAENGGEVVADRDAATHVVLGGSHVIRPTDIKTPFVVQRVESYVLLHKRGLPESYDEWVPVDELEQEVEDEPELAVSPPLTVSSRWLKDLVVYNEWMKDRDYLKKEKKSKKRDADGSVYLDLDNQVTDDSDQENPPKKQKRDDYPVPRHARWFNIYSIHDKEKEYLPEFFTTTNPAKTPKLYQEYRNFMIKSYRANPKVYLTATAVRRNLTGDVNAILRVHGFLEEWGLINYKAEADTRPAPASSQSFPTLERDDPASAPLNPNAGDEWTAQETDKLLDAIRFYQDDWERISGHVGNKTAEQCVLHFVRLPIEDAFLKENIYGPADSVDLNRNGDDASRFGGKTEEVVTDTIKALTDSILPSVATAAAEGAIAAFSKEAGKKKSEKVGEATEDEPAAAYANDDEDTEALRLSILSNDPTVKTATAIGAMASKAKMLALQDEEQIQMLVQDIVEVQLKKLEAKVALIEGMDAALDEQRWSIAQQRREFYGEQLTAAAARVGVTTNNLVPIEKPAEEKTA